MLGSITCWILVLWLWSPIQKKSFLQNIPCQLPSQDMVDTLKMFVKQISKELFFYTISYLFYHRVWISLWKYCSVANLFIWKITISAFSGQWDLWQIIQLICISIFLCLEQVIITLTVLGNSFEVLYPAEVQLVVKTYDY